MACVFLLACGCANKPVDIVGKWKLNTPVPLPGANSTDVTFAADHSFSGVYSGTWALYGDVVTLHITAMGGMSMDTLKGMMASQPNGDAASKFLDSMPLKVDSSGKSMTLTDNKGHTSPMPMFTKE